MPVEHWVFCAVFGLLALVAIWMWGYNTGKRVLISLLERHRDRGVGFEIALRYERDVMNKRVPRG